MRILGLSAFYHDSAAALLVGGGIVAAAQEERFTRKKHDSAFPRRAIEYCLGEAGVSLKQVDYVVFYDKPFLKFERLLESYIAFAPKGFSSFRNALPVWLKEKLFQRSLLNRSLRYLDPEFDEKRLLFSEHHQSHAASAFFASPFDRAAILTMDGVGEWATTSVSLGNGNDLKTVRELHFPHSLGLLYSAMTHYLGFRVNSGEYKVMGLAPYGEPKFTQAILDHLVDIKDDGSFRLNMDYFDFATGTRMTNTRFDTLFQSAAREPEELITLRHMDLAASVQAVVEEIVLRMTRSLARETGEKNLCLAGGVALNCVCNGRVLRDGRFDRIWVQPASGDAGGAIGAALAGYHSFLGKPRLADEQTDKMRGSYLGPHFSQREIEDRLNDVGAKTTVLEDGELFARAVNDLCEQRVLGWFQGRMEFGPRALGARSIIADPRAPDMQTHLNLKIKYRESFRPFAPAILRAALEDWFEIDTDSPYMLMVAEVIRSRRRQMTEDERSLFGIDKLKVPRSEIPAVTHLDYSARIQTVHEDTNPRFHALLTAFNEMTGCPVLVNTSFNVRGEPIVCTPEDAFRCFMGTDMDSLAIGNCYLSKNDQDPELKENYRDRFKLD